METQNVGHNERALEKKENSGLHTGIFLLSLMAAAVLVSFFFYLDLSLRLDEAQSLWQTRQSFEGIANTIAQDVHVPLYHVLLHIWQVFLGSDVSTARALSLIFFVLNIPAFFMLARLAYNRSVAFFSTFLFALSPFMNWYGSEIRMYSLFSLLITLNYYFFLRIYKGGSIGSWVGYTLTAVLGVYTHYFFFFAFATELVFYLFNRSRFPDKSLKRFLTSMGIVALSFIPWVLFVLSRSSLADMSPLLSTPTSIDIFNALTQFIVGFQTDAVNTILISLWPLTILLVFLGLRKNSRITKESVFFILAVTVPLFIAFAVSILYRPVFLSRYLILALPPLFLIVSSLVLSYPKRLSQVFQVAMIGVVMTTLTIQGYSKETPVKEDYRSVTEYLNNETTPRDVVVLSAPFTVYPFEYYYTGLGSIATIPNWDRVKPGPIPNFSSETIDEEVENITENRNRLFLLLSYDQGYESEVRDYFENNYERLDHRKVSHDLNLYVYRISYE